MTKRLLFLIACFNAISFGLLAQTPEWSKDIAPIIYNKCASCHRTGGVAPFSLTSFQQASAQAGAISAAVQQKHMPPWPPDPAYSRLAHERLLARHEINKIVAWVNGNKPQGNPAQEPPLPQFNPLGELPGTPDLVAQIPTYTSTAQNGDVYQCFVIPSGLSADKFITGFEAIPGNRPIVHHVLVYADTTGTCKNLDNATTEPGYTNFGGVGTDDAILLGGWVPGTKPLSYPNGFGVKLPKNADIVIQIHYPQGSQGQTDDTKINFFFSPTPVRDVYIMPILNHINTITPALNIPANQTKTFTEHYQLPAILGHMSLLGVAPHMHLIGRNISVWGVNGVDTQKFIRINNWDFHWQGFYMFKKIMKVPAGTDLYSKAFYDNTSNNPFNPSNPPQNVTAGEGTKDEMMLTYFIFTFYQPGDENIVIDATDPLSINNATGYASQELFAPYPNPATDKLMVKCHFNNPDMGSMEITDMQGRVVKRLMQNEKMQGGYMIYNYSVGDLADGIYQLTLTTGERKLTQKLVIKH